jgi:hypothetical protein
MAMLIRLARSPMPRACQSPLTNHLIISHPSPRHRSPKDLALSDADEECAG